MLSLGIDPGTATVGYGLVRELNDGSLQAVDYGVITTLPSMPMPERLKLIYDGVTALVERHQPDRAAVEDLLFGKNVTTAITVAQGRGVICWRWSTRKCRRRNSSRRSSNSRFPGMVARRNRKCRR